MLMVQKFGGTSVAGVEAVRRAAGILASAVRSGAAVAAVLSAQGDTTDALLSTAAQYNPNPSPRELDMLLSTGEQASVALDRKSTRLNSSHPTTSRMPSSA